MMSNSRYQQFLLFSLITIGAIIEVADAKPPSRISGASDATPGAVPWVISIGLWNGGVRPVHICGGAIIGRRVILTAAHCVDTKNGRPLSISGGVTDLRDENAILAYVTNILLHPHYVKPRSIHQQVQNDIALMTLDRDLNLGHGVTKVSLPNSMPVNHQHATIAGWGVISENPEIRTFNLKIADVAYLDTNECSDLVGDHHAPQFFCGIQANGNILFGDSGSPLVSRGEIIGIVSSGWSIVEVPDLYTNVYHYRDWINAMLARIPYAV